MITVAFTLAGNLSHDYPLLTNESTTFQVTNTGGARKIIYMNNRLWRILRECSL